MATYKISYASDLGWANGQAPSSLVGAPATYDPATVGIDIFRSPGELRTGFASTEIGGSTVDQDIIHMIAITEYTAASATRSAFCYASGGDMYKITDEATPSVSLLFTASSPVAGGLVNHKNYLYYPRTTAIGRYGSLAAGVGGATNDASYLINLSATAKGINITHPIWSWNGKLYVGDAQTLKYVLGSETSGTSGSTGLTFEADHVITALNDNGTRLLIGAGIEPDPDQTTKSNAWLYIWDGSSTSYNERVLFPEPYIHKIEVLDNNILVFGRNYLYKLVGSSFQIISGLGQKVGPGGTSVNRGQLFWKDNDKIMAMGTPDPQLPKAVYSPYSGTGTTSDAILWMQDAKLWVADNSNLNELKTGSATGKTWISRRVSQSQQFMVEEVRLYLAANLASGDDVRIKIYDEAGTAVTVLTFDFATYGAVNQIILHANQFGAGIDQLSSMQIGVNFYGGAVRVREVAVITEPISQR